MIHLFGDEKRRKINLGGASKVASQAELLEAARGRRSERSEQKRRSDAALRIQSWWRGVREAREVKIRLKGAFERDVVGLDGLRCLVLIGDKDEEALGTWSSQMVQGGEGEWLLRHFFDGN
jgi:ubiquitin-protein ligase E3 C